MPLWYLLWGMQFESECERVGTVMNAYLKESQRKK